MANKKDVRRPANEDKNPLDQIVAYYEENRKRINSITTVVLVIVVGALAYFKLYRAPRVEKAATNIAYAQRMFAIDSLDLALNGDAQNPGFLKVKRKYGGTPAANLANYYIGTIYLRKGDFAQAIKFLKDFDGKGTKVEYMAYGALGDAYMESGKTKEGISSYEKASKSGDDAIAPIYLYRLAVAAEMNGDIDKAGKAYKQIKDNYPQSQVAQDIDRHVARTVGLVE